MFFSSTQKGLIALDIDGTITAEKHSIPPQVIEFLHSLYQKGWVLAFVTGRPFDWAYRTLKKLPFPYFFAVQNGVTLLQMPDRSILDRKCLTVDIIPKMEAICQSEQTDFVIYTGFEHADLCYYCPLRLEKEIRCYMEQRAAALQEKWQAVDSFESLSLNSFASLKCFAKEDQAIRLKKKIEKELGLHVPLNRDPFNEMYLVVQATHPLATKGEAVRRLSNVISHAMPVIAAGDDQNDITMLEAATIKIVMQTASREILALADIVAPSAAENGIIEGIKRALELWNQRKDNQNA